MIIKGFSKLLELMSHMRIRILKMASFRDMLSTDSWSCPPAGIVKINVAAHIVLGSHVGLGAVARSTDGQLIWGVVRRSEATSEVEIAEVAAVRFGLHLAKRLGNNRV